MGTVIDVMNGEKESRLPYEVGALLYSPANNQTIADSVIDERFGKRYSLALCLEDAISDQAVESAEHIVTDTLNRIGEAKSLMNFFLPMIFVRVRRPEQIPKLWDQLGKDNKVLKGFIAPKFNLVSAEEYKKAILKVNQESEDKVYLMPILESEELVNPSIRPHFLNELKAEIDSMKEYILNVRVGGNDLCRNFGVRRHMDETIYDIRVVSDILIDIVATFSRDYVVSGAVWEYFDSPRGEWREGLRKELELDLLNGFIGKTVIHPKQIDVVNQAMMVEAEDYFDAIKIQKLSANESVFVEKSTSGSRMNEYKTHIIWAEKMVKLAKIYGVRETCSKQKSKITLL